MPQIKVENGYINYTIEEDEVTIDLVKVFEPRQGTGKQLVKQVLDISYELELPCGLYAEPQDDTISLQDLQKFYYSCGFDLDPNDTDNKLFIKK